MIWHLSMFSSPMDVSRLSSVIVFVALTGVCGVVVGQVQYLKKPSDITALCDRAAPFPDAGSAPVLRHVDLRQASIHKVYAVDVLADRVGALRYDGSAQMLTLVHRAGYVLFDGTQVIRLRGDPLVGFGLNQDQAEVVTVDWLAGVAAIRLYFVPDAFHDPFDPFCVQNGPRTQLQGVLLAAHLVMASEDGDFPSPVLATPLARAESDQGRALGQIIGIGADGAPSKPLYRVWVGKSAVLTGELSAAQQTVWKESVDSLVPSCHVAAMASGGPRTGSLVAIAKFSPGSGVSASVPVELTGYPAFGACVSRILAHLPRPDVTGDVQVKFVLYFEPISATDGTQWRR